MGAGVTTSIEARHGLALSFDVGGTFTDFVAVDLGSGALMARHKLLTNARQPAQSVLAGWDTLVARGVVTPESVEQLVHSTTLVTNALIERKGAPTVLLATRGFRDILELAREQMYDIYDLFAPPPAPLIPRPFRLEIDERIDATGRVLSAPSQASIEAAIERIQQLGATAVAIAFLHSYVNPEHEQLVREQIAQALPGIAISLSCLVAPIAGEYERTSTVAADAYTRPAVQTYVGELLAAFEQAGAKAPLRLMLSSGEIASARTGVERPIRLLESGPAAGAIAAAYIGALSGERDLLSLDMGGTTAKACVIEDGQPELAQLLEVARERRFMKGSGLPIVAPVVDLIEIGAGGGSIARRDELGLLKVGPDSAGADPGPVCYGLGGIEPTVSDANLLLGYLSADYFLGGEIALRADPARDAVARLADELGLTPDAAAWGIHRVVNENMAAAARVHIIERNRDPRRLAVVAFGGAGPAHAAAVARILGSPRVILPLGAGVASALGALVAPLAFTAGQTLMTRLDTADWTAVNEMYANLESQATAELAGTGVDASSVSVRRWAEMRLEAQYHEISVPLPGGMLGEFTLPDITRAFEAAYARQYGRVLEGLPIEALHWRLTVAGPGRTIEVQELPRGDVDASIAIKGERQVYFPDGGFRATTVYDRERLCSGMCFCGPAIVEEREATTVIWPGDRARIDGHLSVIIDVQPQFGEQR